MYTAIVLDPRSFTRENFTDRIKQAGCLEVFRALNLNAVLIMDVNGVMLEQFRRRIAKFNSEALAEELSVGSSQRLLILLAEFLKNTRAHTRCVELAGAKLNRTMSSVELAKLARVGRADLVVSDHDQPKDNQTEWTDFDGYRDSRCEGLRRWFLEEMPSIDKLSNDKQSLFFSHLLRHTARIVVYDKMIGISLSSDSMPFMAGMQYLIDCWRSASVFASRALEFGVLTCLQLGRKAEAAQQLRSLEQQCRQCLDLRGVTLNVFVKQDTSRVFHARHLETDNGICQVDPGFDFVRKGRMRRIIFQYDWKNRDHLSELFGLETVGKISISGLVVA